MMQQSTLLLSHSREPITRMFMGMFLGILALCANVLGQTETKSGSSDAIDFQKWKMHEVAAQDLLKKASECIRKSLSSVTKCEGGDYLGKAAEEYTKMQFLLKDGSGDPEEAAHIAEGFVRSGLPVRAVEFLIHRPRILHESRLLRLLADTLFLLGDDKSAAAAYKLWISAGCVGYSSISMPTYIHMWIEKGKECSQLPIFLRSRLEFLQEDEGEPSNLPLHNDPPYMDNWKETIPKPDTKK
jgi:hypothetical protein